MVASSSSLWLMLLPLWLATYSHISRLDRVGYVDAFAPPHTASVKTYASTRTFRYSSILLLSNLSNNEDDSPPPLENEPKNNNNCKKNAPGVDRRGTLMALLGGFASFAAGDALLNVAVKASGAAGTAVVAAGGGLYERVIAFGQKYRGAAVASEDLTTWIASQTVAATPEIRAWLSAQRELQKIRKATAAATAVLSRTKTAKKATALGSGVLEEGMLTAAAAAAVKSISKERQDVDSVKSSNEEPSSSTVLEAEGTLIDEAKDNHQFAGESLDLMPQDDSSVQGSSNEKNLLENEPSNG